MLLIKKIIPFEKELLFKTKVSEITSISLEHKINKIEEDLISGIFVISGDYKMTEGSIIREKFNYDVGFDIALDNRYDTRDLIVDIDNFTYKIINDEVLKVNIDLFIDGEVIKDDSLVVMHPEIKKEDIFIDEKINKDEEVENTKLQIEDNDNISKSSEANSNIVHIEERQDNIVSDLSEEEDVINLKNSIFGDIDKTETYATYYVYIVKEDDTIEKIMERYSVERDDICLYNSIENIKPGDKIIIPTCNNG